jgi:hypothetical protein
MAAGHLPAAAAHVHVPSAATHVHAHVATAASHVHAHVTAASVAHVTSTHAMVGSVSPLRKARGGHGQRDRKGNDGRR